MGFAHTASVNDLEAKEKAHRNPALLAALLFIAVMFNQVGATPAAGSCAACAS
jgi:hypothetical protein